MYHRFFTLTLWLVILLPSVVEAFDPLLYSVLPRGGTRGQEVEINLYGARLHDPQELLSSQNTVFPTHTHTYTHTHTEAQTGRTQDVLRT